MCHLLSSWKMNVNKYTIGWYKQAAEKINASLYEAIAIRLGIKLQREKRAMNFKRRKSL